jgi:hypothetical protein
MKYFFLMLHPVLQSSQIINIHKLFEGEPGSIVR